MEWEDRLKDRATATLSLYNILGEEKVIPHIGEAIEVVHDSSTEFAGTVDEVKEEVIGSSSVMKVDIALVDHNQIADRRLVSDSFSGMTLYEIVDQLYTDYLEPEGVSKGVIQGEGIDMEDIQCSYQPLSDLLDDLCDLTGFNWHIDFDKSFSLFSRETYEAPFSCTDSQNNCRSLQVTRHRMDYSNIEYLRAGRDRTALLTDTFVGDGERRTFTLSFPLAKEPTIYVDRGSGYEQETVGVRGMDETAQWYFSFQSSEISQDREESKLTSSDRLKVEFRGLYPIIVKTQEGEEIDARKEVEGGTGFYEHLSEDRNINDRSLAERKAQSILDRRARIGKEVDIHTRRPGLRAGQLLYVKFTDHDLDSFALIESIRAKDMGGEVEYRVKAIPGRTRDEWVDYFRMLSKASKSYIPRENEKVMELRYMKDGVVCVDSLSVSVSDPAFLVGFADADYATVI